MKREGKFILSMMLVFAMVFSLLLSAAAPAEAASKKVKLSSKKITVKVGKTKTIKVKNTKNKVKWSVKSGKKVVTLTKKKKTSVGIKGKNAGKAVVTAKVGKKTLKCNVTVTAAGNTGDEKQQPSQVPATGTPVSPTPVPPTQLPSQLPSQNPGETILPSQTPGQTSEPPVEGEPVKNVVIDMTKAGTTTFTSSPAYINFSSQIEERFDLSYFSELKIGYTLEFEGEDTSLMTHGKLAIAGTTDDLNGYNDDEVTVTYGMVPGKDSVSISLAGDDITGTAVGINIQPMNENTNWGWPATLKSVTITSIEFVAKEGAVYAAPGTVTPSQKPDVTPGFESSEFIYDGLDKEWIEENIDLAKPVVAMSFDDGPGTYGGYVEYGTQIQEALTAAGAHATFFYIGQHIERGGDCRQEVENACKAGFEVANHSYDSKGLNSLKDAETIKKKIDDTDALLHDITGYDHFLFRAPNVAYSDLMYAVIEKPFIDVSIWSEDYQGSVDKDAIVKNVTDKLKNNGGDGGIINMHSVYEKTAQAVPEILEFCKENGIQVVSVSELFYIKGQKLMTGVKYYSCPTK